MEHLVPSDDDSESEYLPNTRTAMRPKSKILTFLCLRRYLMLVNCLYLVLGLILMTLPVYFKMNAMLRSWPINGGIISVGVFLSLLSVAGLYGSWKHHQIILFFYMILLVILFILLFAFALGALAITKGQQRAVLKRGWESLSLSTIKDVQKFGDCCGFDNKNVTGTPLDGSCAQLPCCKDTKLTDCSGCQTCLNRLESTKFKTFRQSLGGVSLFFSFTMFLGVYFAFRFRHLRNPAANPNEYL